MAEIKTQKTGIAARTQTRPAYTPGPWEYDQPSYSAQVDETTADVRKDGKILAVIYNADHAPEPDARLIAAAPELAEWLGKALEVMENLGVSRADRQPFIAALRKAGVL